MLNQCFLDFDFDEKRSRPSPGDEK